MSDLTKMELLAMKNDIDSYTSKLFDIAKNNSDRIDDFVDLFEEALFQDEEWYLQKVGIYGLLFKKSIDKKSYVDKALTILFDKKNDSELRSWALMGLEQVKDSKFIPDFFVAKLYSTMEDENEEELIRNACLEGILVFNGISKRDIFLKSFDEEKMGGLDIPLMYKLNKFAEELREFRPLN